jgi:hypothetical protein
MITIQDLTTIVTIGTGTTGDTLTTGDGITGVGITTTGIILLFIMALGLDNYLNRKQDQDQERLRELYQNQKKIE